MTRNQKFAAILAMAGLGTSPLALSSTLPLSDSWTSVDGINIASTDGSGANTATPVPGSYDYSHTVTAANAPFTIPGSVSGSYPLGFEFYDDYVFTVTGAVANSVTSTISMGALLGISNLQARLFKYEPPPLLPYIGPPPLGTMIQAWGAAFSCGSGCSGESVVLANTVLNPGTYVLELRGIVSGSLSGSYGGALNLTPIPVPAAVWLFGSALVGLGWMRRRAD